MYLLRFPIQDEKFENAIVVNPGVLGRDNVSALPDFNTVMQDISLHKDETYYFLKLP